MSEIRDFISARIAELSPQAETLEAQLSVIQAELADLRKALAALDKGTSYGKPRQRPPGDETIQGQALAVLCARGPLLASEIGGEIERRFSRIIARTSLAPQLSRLVRDGAVVRQAPRYRRAEQAPSA
ncbi:UNVERIFIED_ORG: hypothetical protein M2442_002681 [Methylorubrum zatmanii]|nr:hypothetical protein [Methylorubrum pseudosasae]MDH6666682.1 hypothetical protein [Methylorubrum zatmanii]